MHWLLVLLLIAVLFAGTVAALVFLRMFLAKSYAIKRRKNEVSLFGGMVKLILWEQNEGLVLLKNRQLTADGLIYGPEHGGGTKFIYPFLGQELRLRVPMTLKLTQFEDSKVMTREAIQVFLKVAFWWRVQDLEKFYLSIRKEADFSTDDHRHDAIMEALPADPAELWLLTMAESSIRKLVSQNGLAQLVSKSAVQYLQAGEAPYALPRARGTASAVSDEIDTNSNRLLHESGTPHFLAGEIQEMLKREIAKYGLELDRVEIQEMRLPHGVQTAIHNIWEAAMRPAQSEAEARAEQIRLKAAAEVIGADAVAVREVVKNFKGTVVGTGMFESLFARIAGTTPPAALEKSLPRMGKSVKDSPRVGTSDNSAISCICPSCGAKVRVRDSLAGKTTSCPRCKSDIAVPST